MTEQHAEFEALSAYVDGEAPEWADHVEGCAKCRATAAQLRVVSNAVSRPVDVPSAADREAAIAAAVERFSTSEAVVVDPERDAHRPQLAPERPASGRPRTARPWAIPAVAAVIIGVLGFSGLVLSSYRSPDDATTLAGPGLTSDKTESGVAANAPSAPVGDLGDIPDVATLRARALPGAPPAAASSALSSSSAASGAASDTAASQSGATNTGATGGAGGTALNQRAAAPSVVGTRPCEERARSRTPGLREVVYFATARQGQEAAYILGFATGPAPAPVTLLLLAQDDCAELLRSTGP